MTDHDADLAHRPFAIPAAAPALSAGGARRREAMLGELVGAMEHMHRARRRRRRALGTAGIVLLTAGGALLVGRTLVLRGPGDAPDRVALLRPTEVAPAPPSNADGPSVATVRTSESVLDRYAAPEPALRAEVLDDEALLDELAAMGRPAGLIRAGGVVRLTSHVAETEPAPRDPGTG